MTVLPGFAQCADQSNAVILSEAKDPCAASKPYAIESPADRPGPHSSPAATRGCASNPRAIASPSLAFTYHSTLRRLYRKNHESGEYLIFCVILFSPNNRLMLHGGNIFLCSVIPECCYRESSTVQCDHVLDSGLTACRNDGIIY